MVDSPSNASRVGTWALGRWKLEDLLGQGGMSSVYGAVHRTNGKRVAVKVLHSHLAAIADVVQRFIQEGYAANRVDHPGAVSVIDEGTTEDGSPCLVMERLVGGSLDHWSEHRGPLSLFSTVLILDRLLAVLGAAHRAAIIHRDVKPENLFVTVDGAVKLLDFGIARSGDSSGTQTGATMGTPAYMSPEQAEGRWQEVDARADIFAAGAVAIALLTGAPPRTAETANLVLLQAMSSPLPGLAMRGIDVPPPIVAVVDRAIASRREDRFPSAAAMAIALREAWASVDPRPVADHETTLAPLGKLLAGQAVDAQAELTVACAPPGTTALASGAEQRASSPSVYAPSAFAASSQFSKKEPPSRLRGGLVLALAAAFLVAVVAGVSVTRWLSSDPVVTRAPDPVSAASVSAPAPALSVAPSANVAPPSASVVEVAAPVVPSDAAPSSSSKSPKRAGHGQPGRPAPTASDEMLGHRK